MGLVLDISISNILFSINLSNIVSFNSVPISNLSSVPSIDINLWRNFPISASFER